MSDLLESVLPPDVARLPRSACVVTLWRDRVAAIRSNKHAGRLQLPGGKAEGDESLEQNARRETLEEVGLKVINLLRIHTGPCGGHLCTTFIAHSYDGDFTLRSSEEGEAAWVTLDELLEHGVYPDHTRAWLPRLNLARAILEVERLESENLRLREVVEEVYQTIEIAQRVGADGEYSAQSDRRRIAAVRALACAAAGPVVCSLTCCNRLAVHWSEIGIDACDAHARENPDVQWLTLEHARAWLKPARPEIHGAR